MSETNLMQKIYTYILIYFFLLSPQFNLIVPVHSGVISVALILITILVRKKNAAILSKSLILTSVFFVTLAIYHWMLALIYDNDAINFSAICVSVVVYVIFGWMLALFLDAEDTRSADLLDSIILAIAICALVNAIIVLIQYVVPEVKIALESILMDGNSNIDYLNHSFRLRGIASSGGSTLSLINAIAILFLFFLAMRTRISSGFALFGAIILSCSNIFTGRTGLIFGLIFTFCLYFVIFFRSLSVTHFNFRGALLVGIASFVVLYLVTYENWDAEVLAWAFEWVEGVDSGKLESSSTNDLMSMLYFPDNPTHLLFGVGYFEGINRFYPRTDSGYLKTLLSIGFPLGVLMYLILMLIFAGLVKISSDYFWLVLSVIATMIFVEIKEPVFYQNFSSRAMLLLSGVAMYLNFKNKQRIISDRKNQFQ